MNVSMSYYDQPLLLGRGFSFSTIDFDIMWGKDVNGEEWQVVNDGRFLNFAKRVPGKSVLSSHRLMKRTEFEQLFKEK